jgi:hypothetical protein
MRSGHSTAVLAKVTFKPSVLRPTLPGFKQIDRVAMGNRHQEALQHESRKDHRFKEVGGSLDNGNCSVQTFPG